MESSEIENFTVEAFLSGLKDRFTEVSGRTTLSTVSVWRLIQTDPNTLGNLLMETGMELVSLDGPTERSISALSTITKEKGMVN